MKKLTLSLLCIGLLTISVNAKECELIVTPSDFQLDNQLRAPNESLEFSATGNSMYISHIRGLTKGVFCGILTNSTGDEAKACMVEVDNFLEKDSAKRNGSKVEDILLRNITDGFKMSPHAPISKVHLCSIQNKYQTKNTLPRSRFLPLLLKQQEEIRKNYLEASQIVGQSKDMEDIDLTIIMIMNRG